MVISKPIQAGDTAKFEFSANYDGSIFTPYLVLNNRFNKYTVTGSGNNPFELNISASISSGYQSGEYAYTIYFSDGTDRFTYESGFVSVLPDLTATAIDTRTPAQKALEAIKATIQGVATTAHQQMSINGRSLSRYSIDELLKLKSDIEKDIKSEERANQFGKTGKKILVRF